MNKIEFKVGDKFLIWSRRSTKTLATISKITPTGKLRLSDNSLIKPCVFQSISSSNGWYSTFYYHESTDEFKKFEE